MTTSHYEVYGTLPTMTEEQKEQLLTPYNMPEAGSETLGGVYQAENVPDSTATTVAGLKDTVNGLLAALKAAGVMEPDEEEGES